MQFPSYIFLDKFMFLMTFLECTWKKTGQIWTDTLNLLFCYEIYFQKREKNNQEQVYITIITINNKYLHNYQSFSFYLNCPIFAPTVQICPCPDLPLGTVLDRGQLGMGNVETGKLMWWLIECSSHISSYCSKWARGKTSP